MNDAEKAYEAGRSNGASAPPSGANWDRYQQGRADRQRTDEAHEQLLHAGEQRGPSLMDTVKQSPPIHISIPPAKARFILAILIGVGLAAAVTRDKSMFIPIAVLFALCIRVMMSLFTPGRTGNRGMPGLIARLLVPMLIGVIALEAWEAYDASKTHQPLGSPALIAGLISGSVLGLFIGMILVYLRRGK